jgi:hypothetical protein
MWVHDICVSRCNVGEVHTLFKLLRKAEVITRHRRENKKLWVRAGFK